MATAATQTRDTHETQQQLWQMLVLAHGRAHTAIERALQEAELPPLAWLDVLQPISVSADQMLRPRDLGCGVQISRSGLTRLLDRMESAGVIVRRHCDEDRRGSYIGLTDAGVAMTANMREVVESELAMMFDDLFDEGETSQLIGLLSRIAAD